MNLPNTFATCAPLGGKVARIVVDIDAKGEIVMLSDMAEHPDDCDTTISAASPEHDAARAWALKSLVWLEAEMAKASRESFYLRGVAQHLGILRAAVAELAQFPKQKKRTELMDAATELWRSLPEDVFGLEKAFMRDLCDRMSAEMERQAKEAVKAECRCGVARYFVQQSSGDANAHFGDCPQAVHGSVHV